MGPESSNDSSSEDVLWRNSRTSTPHSSSPLGSFRANRPEIASNSVPVDPSTYEELLKEQDVKKSRLARKAELARLSRKRKKSALEFLESEVSRLQEELAEERKMARIAEEKLTQLQGDSFKVSGKTAASDSAAGDNIAAAGTQPLDEQVKQVSTSLRAMVQKGQANSADAKEAVCQLYNVFKLQSLNSASNLARVKKDLELSLPLRFLEWAMNQPEKFFQDTNGLWRTLWLTDIGLTPSQFEQLVSLRNAFQSQKSAQAEIEKSYAALCQLVESQLVNSSRSLDSICSLLTPEQLAKFLAWVETFGSICIRISG